MNTVLTSFLGELQKVAAAPPPRSVPANAWGKIRFNEHQLQELPTLGPFFASLQERYVGQELNIMDYMDAIALKLADPAIPAEERVRARHLLHMPLGKEIQTFRRAEMEDFPTSARRGLRLKWQEVMGKAPVYVPKPAPTAAAAGLSKGVRQVARGGGALPALAGVGILGAGGITAGLMWRKKNQRKRKK